MQITIGSAEVGDAIAGCLRQALQNLQDGHLRLELGEGRRGDYQFVACQADAAGSERPDDLEGIFRSNLANALAQLVLDTFEERLVRRIIHHNYCYFNAEEQDLLTSRALRAIASADGQPGVEARLARIRDRLCEYLSQADELIVEGFVTFRLRDYVDELEDAVDRAVDDLLMEREYREFIRLLKHFVDVQEPRVSEVHVLLGSGGAFQLMDGQGRLLKDEYLEEFVADLVDTEVNHEDLLISALITAAPSRVVLHGHQVAAGGAAVDTIRSVFSDRVSDCPGCAHCRALRPVAAVGRADRP